MDFKNFNTKVANAARSLLLLMSASILAVSCQESLEEKAERDAKEYTRRYCPTPVINSTRTDSITFSKTKRVYTYHISFVGDLDDAELINEHKEEIQQMLSSSLRESTGMKPYIEAGFKFEYICRSASDKNTVLLRTRLN